MSNYRITNKVTHHSDNYPENSHEREIAHRLYAAERAIKELQTNELIGSNFLVRSLKILAYNLVGIILIIGAYSVLEALWNAYWQWLR